MALQEGIVKAAQTRCITCDPGRLHYAVEAGGACEPCAALELETAALIGEMGAAEDSDAATSEAASAPADHPLDPDGPEEPPGVATDRPGMNVDAAVEPSLPAGPPPVGELGGGDGAGSGQADAAPSGVESGVAAPDSGVEGVAVAGSPSTDPVSMFVRRQIAEHDRFMADFVAFAEDLGVGELQKLRQLHAERGHVLAL
jgi:hypothetical protein